MTMQQTTKTTCADLRDDLAAVVSGDRDALARHAEHLSSCDACRDLRHEATQAATLVHDAADDYVAPEDLSRRVLAAIDAGVQPSVTVPMSSVQSQVQLHAAADGTQTARGVSASVDRELDVTRDARRTSGVHAAKPSRGSGRVVAIAVAAVVLLGLGGAAAVGFVLLAKTRSADVTGPVATNTPAATNGANAARLDALEGSGVTGASGASLSAGAKLADGTVVRTDERSRARLVLADGSAVVLNQNTEIVLESAAERRTRLVRGELVADVTHLDQGPRATFVLPTGHIDVLGTKFSLAVADDAASVRVTRGAVRAFASGGGAPVDVKAGQEGLVAKSGGVTVAQAVELARSIAWSDLGAQATEDAPIPGLGELRAHRPGERQERERPLTLARHRVTVRISGNVARTEIEEEFANDGGDTLEGQYKFPLPPDASIAKLALDVDGRMEEGAFVDRDRAARIWRGVIRNATAPAQRKPDEDYVWVPGPWRDPALLEWQRGGRFELRIFPIPAHGSRRIQIAYTQVLAPHGNGRRYVYPLPHGANARVGQFEVDARVLGASRVNVQGYRADTQTGAEGTTLSYRASDFAPSGDLILDFTSNEPATELRTWTYAGNVATPPAANSREEAPDVVAAQQAYAADGRAFVAFALRPELPMRRASEARDYAIVVDASQSMVGERYLRATRVASALVGELDRRDRFVVLACDVSCRAMRSEPGMPSAQASTEAAAWLASIRPAGGSNLVRALRDGAHAFAGKSLPGHDVHVLYVGDGTASVGHRETSDVVAEVTAMARDEHVAFTTVGIGGDSDARTLASIARAGGGHFVPYTPGERLAETALSILETTYGVALQNATLELPPGVSDVAPARLPTIRAGEEVLVTARFSGELRGEIVLRGEVAGEPYEDRYPLALVASTSAGNAFVPALWAGKTIEDLDATGAADARAKTVALSKAFHVMSRHTSLLVLESDAMFRAFGVDRAQANVQWTGEEATQSVATAGTQRHTADLAALDEAAEDTDSEAAAQGNEADERRDIGSLGDATTAGVIGGGLGLRGSGQGGGGRGNGMPLASLAASAGAGTRSSEGRARAEASREAQEMPARRAAPGADMLAMPATRAAPAAPPMQQMQMPTVPRPGGGPGRGRWMRRVYFRVGSAGAYRVTAGEVSAVAVAENGLTAAPDSRDKHRALVRAASRAGNVDRAYEIAEKWLGRDRLDAEALTYLADTVARRGRRDEALRFLSGLADLRSDDRATHERLARAYERAGERELSCAHRISLAELPQADDATLASAVRCERETEAAAAATRLLAKVTDGARRARLESLATTPVSVETPSGDIVADATWSGGSDLDIALIAPNGTRISWMGGRAGTAVSDVSDANRERFGLRRAGTGTYVVEVTRTDPNDRAPIQGRLTLTVLGTRQTLPFSLGDAQRIGVARAEIRRESRLEQVW